MCQACLNVCSGFMVCQFRGYVTFCTASAGDVASCFMMMEDDDHSEYISQLRAEFDSCDSSASGFLDRDDLTALCQKLHLESHLQQLLDTLLRRRACGRVDIHAARTNTQ